MSNPFRDDDAILKPPPVQVLADASVEQTTSAYGARDPNQLPMALAIGSLVCSLVGTVACGCCLFLPFPMLSITLGSAALLTRPPQNASIMAIIGIVLSALTLIVSIGLQLILMLSNGANH